LHAIGRWLGVNGEAIYGTRPWKMSEEGSVHFTTKGQTLFAISLAWPTNELMIPALGRDQELAGRIDTVELLGHAGTLEFTQAAEGLKVTFPEKQPCDYCYALKISGLKLAPAAASIPVHPDAAAPGGPGLIPQ